MKFFGYDIGRKAEPLSDRGAGDVAINDTSGIMKAYIPDFLYKPPFGYPRKENIPLLRQLAKNPYIYSVIKSIADEAASTHYDIVYKEEAEPTPAADKIRLDILKFLDNPNNNKESFQYILRAVVKDVCEVDAGVIVKIFNKGGQFVEMFARDGGSFLLNPDIYGYIGNRTDYVMPVNINYAMTPESPDWQSTIHQYGLAYKEVAAYFQYGTTAMALPVPFGRREIVYVKANPQSNNVYGLSPIQILADTITTLVYGANYNLDFYMNNNMPEGVISLLNGDQDSITAFRNRFDKQFRVKDTITGFMRKVGFKFPIVNQEVKFTPFQLDPKVMQIIEQQEWFTKLVWGAFGVTAEEMGFTQDSNKAVAENQSKVNKRKAVKPMLLNIKYHIDKEIIPEWGEEAFELLEFKWDDYDLTEDIQRHTLYEAQIRMGIKTPEMVAEEENIDVVELTKQKDENAEKELDREIKTQNAGFNGDEGPGNKSMKALGIMKGTRVKVTGNHKAHAGKTGIVEYIKTNGEEKVYMVRFQDGMDVFFYEELKVIDGGVQLEEPEFEDAYVEEKSMKADKPWNDLEKDLVAAMKTRGKEILSRIDQLKSSELDKIQ